MSGINGYGTQLAKGDGASPEVFTAIAGITEISGPGISRNSVEVTAHDSPDGYQEYVPGLKDPGEVELTVNYDPSKHDTFLADYDSDEVHSYKITWPGSGATWAFSGFLNNFEPDAPVDDKLSAKIKFQVTGKVTPAAGGGV
ncbi:phage tail tube protein [Actinocatenispora sera]|uniref:phage tail tube protein n=1 Tax=Actinocatenispora sera TaxID=390989 RepID=UPI0033ED7A8C